MRPQGHSRPRVLENSPLEGHLRRCEGHPGHRRINPAEHAAGTRRGAGPVAGPAPSVSGRRCRAYRASGPVSPVRTRMTCSIGGDEDLAVTDAVGAGRLHDRVHQLVDLVVVDDRDDRDLGQQVDHVLRATPVLRDAPLDAVALDLGDGQALVAEADERLLDRVERSGRTIASMRFIYASPPAVEYSAPSVTGLVLTKSG